MLFVTLACDPVHLNLWILKVQARHKFNKTQGQGEEGKPNSLFLYTRRSYIRYNLWSLSAWKLCDHYLLWLKMMVVLIVVLVFCLKCIFWGATMFKSQLTSVSKTDIKKHKPVILECILLVGKRDVNIQNKLYSILECEVKKWAVWIFFEQKQIAILNRVVMEKVLIRWYSCITIEQRRDAVDFPLPSSPSGTAPAKRELFALICNVWDKDRWLWIPCPLLPALLPITGFFHCIFQPTLLRGSMEPDFWDWDPSCPTHELYKLAQVT